MSTHADLASEMERFVEEHPNGWDHDGWTGFLTHLANEGHDVWDRDGIGLGLERVRLVQVLNRMEVKGLGLKRTEAIADHFGTLWNLMCASSEEVARATGIPRALAEQISDVLQ
jgi:hypothetical protein